MALRAYGAHLETSDDVNLALSPKRYKSRPMEAARRLIVLFFIALMAFGPVAVQAAACMHSEAVSAVSGDDVKNNQSHSGNSANAERPIPTNDKNALHCATCCLAHSVGAPLSEAVSSSEAVSIAVRIGLPRDWAGVPDRAPNALLRPPRS